VEGCRRGGSEAEERGCGEGGLKALGVRELGEEARGGAERAGRLVRLGGGLGRGEDGGDRRGGGGERPRRPERGGGGGRGGRQRLERAGAGEGDEQARPERYAERGGGRRRRELVLGQRHAAGGPRGEAQAIGGGETGAGGHGKGSASPRGGGGKRKGKGHGTNRVGQWIWMTQGVTWMRPRSRVRLGRPAARRIRGRYAGRTVGDRSPAAYAVWACGLARRGGAGRPPADGAKLSAELQVALQPIEICLEAAWGSVHSVPPLHWTALVDRRLQAYSSLQLQSSGSVETWSQARMLVVIPWASFLAVVLLGS